MGTSDIQAQNLLFFGLSGSFNLLNKALSSYFFYVQMGQVRFFFENTRIFSFGINITHFKLKITGIPVVFPIYLENVVIDFFLTFRTILQQILFRIFLDMPCACVLVPSRSKIKIKNVENTIFSEILSSKLIFPEFFFLTLHPNLDIQLYACGHIKTKC